MCLNTGQSKRETIVSRCIKKIKGNSSTKEGAVSGAEEKKMKKQKGRREIKRKAA